MPNANQDQLYEQFVSVAVDFVAISGGIAGLIGDLSTKSPVNAPSASSSGSSSVLDTLGTVAKSVGENALGAVPLIRGIISLFTGGDDSPAPSKLTKYLLPPSIQFDAASTPSGVRNVDYGQASDPRPFGGVAGGPQASPASAQITVNVQAMDARSFLDRSSDIAAAVREAMLNSSSINDVVSEL